MCDAEPGFDFEERADDQQLLQLKGQVAALKKQQKDVADHLSAAYGLLQPNAERPAKARKQIAAALAVLRVPLPVVVPQKVVCPAASACCPKHRPAGGCGHDQPHLPKSGCKATRTACPACVPTELPPRALIVRPGRNTGEEDV
jgi:ribosomal protein L29